jgi:YD repeat-containing protein
MAALFRDVAARIKADIERGVYPADSRLPTEHQLAEQHGVSRDTITRALGVLKAEGLVEAHTSKGTTVAPPPVRLTIDRYGEVANPNRADADLGPWETACKAAGLDGRTEVVGVDRVPADQSLAKRIGVDTGTELVHRRRRMWARERISQIQDAWMPAALVEGTPLAGSTKIVGGVYAAMTVAGFGPARVTEEITGRPPTTEEQAAIGLPDGATVQEVWRTTYDQAGRIVEVLRTIADARACRFIYDNLPVGRTEG